MLMPYLKLAAVFFFISVSTLVIGQNIIYESEDLVVTAGNLTDRSPGTTMFRSLSASESGCSILTEQLDGYSILEFDEELNPVDSKPISAQALKLTNKNSGEINEGIFSIGGNAYQLKILTDKKGKSNTVVAYNLTSDKASIEPILLSKLEGDGFYKNFYYAGFDFDISRDGSKFSVAYKLGREKTKSGTVYTYRIAVFDQNLDPLWERDFDFKDSKGTVDIGLMSWSYDNNAAPFRLANDGTVFCWARIDKVGDYSGINRFMLKLYKMDNETFTSTKFNKPLSKTTWNIRYVEGKILLMCPFHVDSKSIIYGDNDELEAGGFEIFEWDGEEDSEVVRKQIPLTLEHMYKNVPDKRKETYKKKVDKGEKLSIRSIYVMDVDVLEDGSIVFVAQTVYQRKTLHVFKLNPEFQVEDSYQVPFDSPSYVYRIRKNKLHFLFMDREVNYTRDWNKEEPDNSYGQDGPLSIVTIDLESEAPQTRTMIWNSEEFGGPLSPSMFFNSDESGVAYAYIQGGQAKQRFAKFKFK